MNKLGEVCEHGILKRQCQVCDLESQLAEAQKERDTWKDGFNKVEADRNALKKENEQLQGNIEKGCTFNHAQGFPEQELFEVKAQRDKYRAALENYGQHDMSCISSYLEAGEPTTEGGYRTMYKGKWYQSTPVDETPKCECGLEEALAEPEGMTKGDLDKLEALEKKAKKLAPAVGEAGIFNNTQLFLCELVNAFPALLAELRTARKLAEAVKSATEPRNAWPPGMYELIEKKLTEALAAYRKVKGDSKCA